MRYDIAFDLTDHRCLEFTGIRKIPKARNGKYKLETQQGTTIIYEDKVVAVRAKSSVPLYSVPTPNLENSGEGHNSCPKWWRFWK